MKILHYGNYNFFAKDFYANVIFLGRNIEICQFYVLLCQICESPGYKKFDYCVSWCRASARQVILGFRWYCFFTVGYSTFVAAVTPRLLQKLTLLQILIAHRQIYEDTGVIFPFSERWCASFAEVNWRVLRVVSKFAELV